MHLRIGRAGTGLQFHTYRWSLVIGIYVIPATGKRRLWVDLFDLYA